VPITILKTLQQKPVMPVFTPVSIARKDLIQTFALSAKALYTETTLARSAYVIRDTLMTGTLRYAELVLLWILIVLYAIIR